MSEIYQIYETWSGMPIFKGTKEEVIKEFKLNYSTFTIEGGVPDYFINKLESNELFKNS